MSTFVLVHGAWHGGWCWHKVARLLEAQGHRVLAPDMPGRGGDGVPIQSVTMGDIVARIGGAVESAGEPVVLVGHSYGGAVITQTAEVHADKIGRLVYVTAFLPGNGQTVMDFAQSDENTLKDHVIMSDDFATATVAPDAIRDSFYGECSDEDVAFARGRLGLEAAAGFSTPMQTSAERFGRIPRTYVECVKDEAISIGLQRRMQAALPCETVVTLDTDHSPFFSAPEALAEALAGL